VSKPKKIISVKEATSKAQHLCAEKEKCVYDIRLKLYDWKLPEADHDAVIKQLLEDKFIDEGRYALYYTKDKIIHNKWGRIKIAFALKQKKIKDEFIKNAFDNFSEIEYENILKNELHKKMKTIKDKDEYTIKSKLLRFAASRGFENGKVFDILSEIIKTK
jgi:regulatory protein